MSNGKETKRDQVTCDSYVTITVGPEADCRDEGTDICDIYTYDQGHQIESRDTFSINFGKKQQTGNICSFPYPAFQCMEKSVCESEGGIPVRGYCPNLPKTVQCCIYAEGSQTSDTFFFDKSREKTVLNVEAINSRLRGLYKKYQAKIIIEVVDELPQDLDKNIRDKFHLYYQIDKNTKTGIDMVFVYSKSKDVWRGIGFRECRIKDDALQKILSAPDVESAFTAKDYEKAFNNFIVHFEDEVVKNIRTGEVCKSPEKKKCSEICSGSLSSLTNIVTDCKKICEENHCSWENDKCIEILSDAETLAKKFIISGKTNSFNPNWEEARALTLKDFEAFAKATAKQNNIQQQSVSNLIATVSKDVWKDQVVRRLEEEIKNLDNSIKYSEEASGFLSGVPACNKYLENGYACVLVATSNVYDLRQCTKTRTDYTDPKTGQRTTAAYEWTDDCPLLWFFSDKCKKYTKFDECKNDCLNLDFSKGTCEETREHVTPVEYGTDNFLRYLKERSGTNDVKIVKAGMEKVLSCYKSGKMLAEIQKNPLTCFSGGFAWRSESDPIREAFLSNALLLALTEIESKWDDYQNRAPDIRLCFAALSVSQRFDFGDLKDSDIRDKIAAYRLVLDNCRLAKTKVANTNTIKLAEQRINDISQGTFLQGVWNVAESFGEPANIKIMAGTIVVSAVAPPIGAVIGGQTLLSAVRTAQVVKLFHAGLGTYFGIQMAIGLKDSLALCSSPEIRLSSEACGEATANAVMLLLLLHPTLKGYREGIMPSPEFIQKQTAAYLGRLKKEVEILRLASQESVGEEKINFEKQLERLEREMQNLEKLKNDKNAAKIAAKIMESGRIDEFKTEPLDKKVLQSAENSARSAETQKLASVMKKLVEQAEKDVKKDIEVVKEKVAREVGEGKKAEPIGAEKLRLKYDVSKVLPEDVKFVEGILNEYDMNVVSYYIENKLNIKVGDTLHATSVLKLLGEGEKKRAYLVEIEGDSGKAQFVLKVGQIYPWEAEVPIKYQSIGVFAEQLHDRVSYFDKYTGEYIEH